MAVTCARCGTQNPDGNQFCQACGTPLAMVAAQPSAPPSALPGPPAAPPQPPPGYQSPYYAPSAVGPQPPVHRTPWTLIIAGIVVLVLLMAGCGTAIAVLGSRSTASTGNNQGGGLLPSPSPAGTPSPVATPTPGTTSSGTVSNKGVAFNLPSGWSVVNKDDQSITITNAAGQGSITIASGPSNPAQSAQQNKDTLDKYFQGKYPDTKTCSGSKTGPATLNGATGIVWELCFTLTSGGQSVPAAAPMFAGANADGSVYYAILILSSQADVKAFVGAGGPILDSIQWKLK